MAENMDLQINLVGADDTGKAFNSLDASLSDLQKLSNDVANAFADFSKTLTASMSDAAKATEDMVAPLQDSQRELEALVQSMGDVDRSAQTMGETFAESGREIAASLENAASGTRSLQNGMNQASDSIQQAEDKTRGMGGAVDELGKALSAEMIGEQLKNIGETGLGVFEEASSAAADFEFNISRIGAVLTTVGKATTGQMQQMSDDALKIGSTSSFSANQIAEGMYTLARQGLDATTILGDGANGAINIVNDLAQATDSSMTDTATVVTDIVHEYGLSGEELRNVANIISGTLHNSSENLDDLYQSMKQVGPVASAMHQSVEDVSTALAILAQHGITGSSAGTAIKNMLLGLEPHTKKAIALMKDLGISTKDGAADSFYQLNGNLKPLPDIIQILNDKFGGLNDRQKEAALAATFTKYGLAGLNTIVTQNKDSFKQFQDELRMDDAATIAAKKMDNLHGDMLKFNAGVQTMMKSFGDSINGMLRPAIQQLSQLVKFITELPKPVKEAAMVFLGLASTLAIAGGSVIAFAGGVKMLGPSLELAGFSTAGLHAAAASLGAVFTEILIPFTLVVAAIAAVAIGFKLAYDHIKPFHDAVNNAIVSVKEISEAIQGLWQGGASEGKAISVLDSMGFTPSAISAVQNVFARIKDGITVVKQSFDNVKNAVTGIFMILTGTGGGEGITLLQKLGFDKNTISELMKMGGKFKVIFDGIQADVSAAMKATGDAVHSIIGGLLSYWNDNQGQFQQTAKVVWNDIGNVVRTIVSIMITVINGLLDAGQAVFNGIVFVIGKAKDAFDEVKKKVEDFGTSLSDFKDNVVKDVKQKFDDFTDSLKKHKTAIEVTATVLGVIFGPALILTGTRAAVAGGQIAAQFIAQVVQTGVEAVVAGAKIAASFVANLVMSGVQAVVAGALLTGQFIVAIVQAGAEAVVAGAKFTVNLIGAIVQLGIEAVITAGKITGQAIVALVEYAAEGWLTFASIAATTGALVLNAGAFIAQKVALVASIAATEAMTAAQWLFNVALDANPIGLVVLAIGALVTAGIVLYQNWDTVQSKMSNIWQAIEQGSASMVNGIIGGLNWMIDQIDKLPGVKIDHISNVSWGSGASTGDFQSMNRYASGTNFHSGGPAIVGDGIGSNSGRELFRLPNGSLGLTPSTASVMNLPRGTQVINANATKKLLGLPAYADGTGNVVSDGWNWLKDKLAGFGNSAISMILGGFGGAMGDWASLPESIVSSVSDNLFGWIKDNMFGGSNVSGDVGSWIAQAISITGVPASWAGALNEIIQHESGGNPTAINNWDSNAKAGHASQGLMQLIPSTFASYMVQGLGDITNPVANIVAGIRYILDRYGDISNVNGIKSMANGGPYVGYATGTNFAAGGWSLVGENGPELMYVPRGAQIKTASQTASIFGNAGQTASLPSGSSGGITYNITVHASGNIAKNEQQLADIISRGILQKVKLQGKI